MVFFLIVNAHIYTQSVQPTSDGGYIIGAQTGNGSSYDIWLLKTNSTLDTLWSKRLGNQFNISSWNGKEYYMDVTNDNGYMLAGRDYFTSDIRLIKTDSLANIKWIKKFGGSNYDVPYCVHQTNDGAYIISGQADYVTSNTGQAWLIKDIGCTSTVSITASGTTTFCNGGNVTLTASNANSYQWSNFATTQSIVVSSNGNYSVTVSDGTGCSIISSAVNVTVLQAPGASIGGPTTFCQGNSATLTGSAGVSYSWSTGATTSSITITASGTYSVVVTGANGCITNSVPKTVNAIVCNTGIENYSVEKSIFISPNPFSLQTVLQTDNLFHNATLTVDNCFGQTVVQIKNLSGQTITFYRYNLPSGLYFVRLTEENKTIAVDKLVITDK